MVEQNIRPLSLQKRLNNKPIIFESSLKTSDGTIFSEVLAIPTGLDELEFSCSISDLDPADFPDGIPAGDDQIIDYTWQLIRAGQIVKSLSGSTLTRLTVQQLGVLQAKDTVLITVRLTDGTVDGKGELQIYSYSIPEALPDFE